MVHIQFLGSGDAFGSGGRFQACILLRTELGQVLLDCGATSLVAMKQAGVDPLAIDAVIVSHLHGDHFGGIPFLVLDQQFARRSRPLLVAGPPGLAERLPRTMEALYPGSSTVERRYALRVIELDEGAATAVGPVMVTAFPVVHASGAPAYALRVTAGAATIAYSGDTEWTSSLVECAADSDVFICEGYVDERAVKFHLSAAALRANLARITAARLVLTHMSPEMLARPGAVPGAITAYDGMTLDLS